MAARTRILQLAVAVVNLSIVALAFTSIWPFPSGEFQMHLPKANDVKWSYENGLVHVIAPYSVHNGGVYDVDGLAVSYSVTNDSGHMLSAKTFNIGTIPKGSTHASSLDFTFDLLALYNGGAQWMVFHDDVLNFEIHVSCYYTMKLVKFGASYNADVAWNALIRSWSIEKPSSLPAASTPYNAHYWLNTSDLLAGLPPAQVNVSLFGGGHLLGYGTSEVQLGGDHTGIVAMTVLPSFFSSVYGNYTFSYKIMVLDFLLTGSWSNAASGGAP